MAMDPCAAQRAPGNMNVASATGVHEGECAFWTCLDAGLHRFRWKRKAGYPIASMRGDGRPRPQAAGQQKDDHE
jgi:hypothetical protein